MSQRVSKSPYSSRNRARCIAEKSSTAVTRQPNPVIPPVEHQQLENTPPVEPEVPVNTNSNLHRNNSQNSGGIAQSADLVAAVSSQLMPEIRNEIIQTVNAFRSSPSFAASPDSASPVTQGIMPTPINSIHNNLGSNVSQQQKDKIINGEYVDLGSLITSSSTLTISNTQATPVGINNNGQLILQPKPSKAINDINTWIDAFLIYTTIYTATHPECTQGMLKYIYTVKLGASRASGLGWKDYDQQFRLKRAGNPSMPWGTVDQELWLLYIHPSNNTYRSLQPNTNVTNRKCYEYNNKGFCTLPYCRYLHKCLRCDNPHPVINCRVQVVRNQSNFAQAPSNTAYSGNFRPDRNQNSKLVGRSLFATRQATPMQSNEIGRNAYQSK